MLTDEHFYLQWGKNREMERTKEREKVARVSFFGAKHRGPRSREITASRCFHRCVTNYRYDCRTETILAANESTPLQLATWAPRGNALIYVHQNNIYYRPEAEVPNDYQITRTGVFGTIYNGVPDWVYEGKYTLYSLYFLFELLFNKNFLRQSFFDFLCRRCCLKARL